MNAQLIWQMFLETGAPEVYLLYNKVRKMEESDAFEGPGTRFESHHIQ